MADKESGGINMSAEDIATIIRASGEAKGAGAAPPGPQPQWCGLGCGGHLAAVEATDAEKSE